MLRLLGLVWCDEVDTMTVVLGLGTGRGGIGWLGAEVEGDWSSDDVEVMEALIEALRLGWLGTGWFLKC